MASASEIKRGPELNSPVTTINEPADCGVDSKSSGYVLASCFCVWTEIVGMGQRMNVFHKGIILLHTNTLYLPLSIIFI